MSNSYDKRVSDLPPTSEPSNPTDAVPGSSSEAVGKRSPLTIRSNSSPKFTAVNIDLHQNTQRIALPSGKELPREAAPIPDSGTMVDMKADSKKYKYISLLVLVVQNTALVLTMRYSRTVTSGPLYLASTAVVLTELLKFIICVAMIFRSNDFDPARTLTVLKTEIIDKKAETLRLSVPSVLYTIQNNLLYIALSHLNAATFQVTYQLKILTTALFSVLLLGRSLTRLKWLSLVVLMFAVALVQWPSEANQGKMTEGYYNSMVVGLGAVLLACVSSGFSGVYIEKVLKQSDTSMWIRNIQLSLLSLFIGLFGVLFVDFQAVVADGFFQGYSPIVLVVITLQALGGLVVAAVMKYADNILKGFATSVSIVISSLVSYFVLSDFTPSWYFIVGSTLVLTATFMYSCPAPPQVLPSSTPPSKQKQSL